MQELNHMPETELLKLALAGHEGAFRLLYERLKNGIFRYAFYMTNSRSAAEEVTQEVFVTLLAKGRRYDPAQGDLGAFTFGLARNVVRRVNRRELSYRSLLNDEPVEEQSDALASAPDTLTGNLIRDQRAAAVRAAIAELPEHFRQAVVLCDLLELSYAEAAERLDCAIGTIRSRLSRGHALLAQKLKLLQAPEGEMRDAGTEGCLI
jgi:RNA polymerase sigma-70 factor (ECF subfamily)